MSLKLDPGRRYDMPAFFGPSLMPDKTVVACAESLVLSTTTTREEVEAILPSHFGVPDNPVLIVAHVKYPSVDYLGGRGYSEIVVSVGARFEADQESIETPLAVALWVDHVGALISGREYMGLPKLLGKISDLDDNLHFSCAEYDVAIVEGRAQDLVEVDEERMVRLNSRSSNVRTFGWKYIPGPGHGSDVDAPMLNELHWNYQQAWTGSGEFEFLIPSFEQAPLSASTIAGLARLSVRTPVRAFRGIGEVTINRRATTSLCGRPAEHMSAD